MTRLGWDTLGKSFDCACGVRHALPIEACHIGTDAAEELARFAHGRCGESGLIIADENTRAAAGDRLLSMLGMAHKQVVEKILPGQDFDATLDLAETVAREGVSCDFYVAIGSGTLSDLAKWAGSQQDKPVLLYPTAASMNGYSSAIVALKVRGLKATLPCRPATGIFADPEIAASAPPRMTAAGVADFLSKCSSAADWRAGHLLRGGYYCPRPREFNEGIQARIIEEAPAIGRGEPGAIKLVLEALMLSGFGMVVAGSSAPASGGEHLISHYLDMKHALYGTPNDLHGAQVGVATVHTLDLWEKVLSVDARDLDIDALAAAQPAMDQIREWIVDDWGPEVGKEVLAQWSQKALDTDRLRAELRKFRELLPELRAALSQELESPGIIARCIEETGGPATPEAMLASREEYRNALKRARFLRNRLTVLDLAAELCLA